MNTASRYSGLNPQGANRANQKPEAADRRRTGGNCGCLNPDRPDAARAEGVAELYGGISRDPGQEHLKQQWAEQLVILGEMAGSLAHEIKNPLAGVKASLEILASEPETTDDNRIVLLEGIEQIRRIEGLLKALLNFAKPPKPYFEPIDVRNVLDATTGLALRHPQFNRTKEHAVCIVKEYGGGSSQTMTDPQQLQQVFLNLLLNAAEAMPGGGSITLLTSHDREGVLTISVADIGPGIGDDLKERIFLPFFTTKPHGTGLGLSITRRLIEQQGGSITVRDNLAQGAVFVIELPLLNGKVLHDSSSENRAY